jgi:hypothetical protein
MFTSPFTFGFSLMQQTMYQHTRNSWQVCQYTSVVCHHVYWLKKALNISNITFLGYLGKVYRPIVICNLADGLALLCEQMVIGSNLTRVSIFLNACNYKYVKCRISSYHQYYFLCGRNFLTNYRSYVKFVR